jgi:DNA-directed RNA polymerase subunit RPC12/RpoP
MPIRFACACGKQLQTRDEFAGRRIKCPGCGQILPVPGTTAATPPRVVAVTPAAAPPTPPVAGAPPEPIRFFCTCGTQLQSDTSKLGRQLRCPTCNALVPVPAAPREYIRFLCACGTQLQSDASKAGRQLRCPTCNALVPVPAQSEEPTAAAIEPEPILDDGSLGQRITPWRGDDARRFRDDDREARDRRGERRWLAVFLALVLAGGVAAGLYFWPEFSNHL